MTSARLEFARTVRKHPTRAEDIFWARLRGWRFSWREVSEASSVRPLRRRLLSSRSETRCRPPDRDSGDGRQHEWFKDYDAGRMEVLERLGVRVIGLTNAEICDDLDLALAKIYDALRLPFE